MPDKVTLEKAKEILQEILHNGTEPGYPDCDNAIKLGIEAISRLQAYRLTHSYIAIMPLPGEG